MPKFSFNSSLSFLKGKIKKIDRNTMLVAVAVIAIIITGGLIFINSNHGFTFPTIFGMSNEQIGKKAVDYINSSGLSSTTATLVKVTGESGLVKVTIKIATNEFDSYVTKDGKLLFPQAFDMSEADSSADKDVQANQTPDEAAASIQKGNTSMLEAYVVARCPYGIQMQRAMVEAVKNMPSLAQYIKVRYIGAVSGNTITSMHGDAEAQENLRQICLREEQPTKYWNYVACQMKAGDTAGCESSTGVDSAKLNACVSTPSRGVAFAKIDFDLSAKNNISGSPTLTVNGTKTSEGAFGGRSAEGVKAMACVGFNSEPSFCSTKLSTTEAAVSFSETYEGSGSTGADANCGS
jgi:hypothetical protein